MTTNNEQSATDFSYIQRDEGLLRRKRAFEQAQAKRNKLRKEHTALEWYGSEAKGEAESEMLDAMIDLVGDTYNCAFGIEDEERWEEQPDFLQTQDYATAHGIDYCLVNNMIETGMEEICYQSYERLMNTYEDCEADVQGAMEEIRKQWPGLLKKAKETVDSLDRQRSEGIIDPEFRRYVKNKR